MTGVLGCDRRARVLAVALAIGSLLATTPAAAEEWDDAYEAGVAALARGEHRQAADALRRAIALRPEPGRNVVTYGTNVVPRYFPYLNLADACLSLGQLDAAREALEASAKWGREPADERAKLQARFEAALEERWPTRSEPSPSAIPSAIPTTTMAIAPPATSSIVASSPGPSVAPPTSIARPRSPSASPQATPSPLATPSAEAVPATTLPAPASAKPLPEPPQGNRSTLIAFALVAIALVAAFAWSALRRPAEAAAIWKATPPAAAANDASAAATPAGHASPGAHRDALGQDWFGEFRLLELLGRGGMASVFKVERRAELSALKRPLASLLDEPEFLQRFLREAEIGRTLNHPNIVRIFERGEIARVPYFSMELLAGDTLQAFVRDRGAAEPRTAVAVMVQVAEALDFAHGKGVIHRDLKPSNIMLLPDGTAKVMDFGIARARRFDALTATGGFLGTPDYVAPEMIDGLGTEPRSDLYALGVVLYELLAGRRPFVADSPFAILKKHGSEAPPPPSRFRTGIPQELEEIVLQLLRKDPAERPASAEELVVALRDWLNRAA